MSTHYSKSSIPPPPAAFTAVLFDEAANADVEMQQDGDVYEQPLLMTQELVEQDSNKISPHEASRLKIMSVLSGSMLAFLSQLALSQLLWDENILSKSTFQVVVFSLSWSFWTCFVVFAGMMLLIRSINLKRELSEDMTFQMEAHHVAGALSSVTLTWLLNDIFHIQSKFLASPKHQWIVVALIFAAYGIFVSWILVSARTAIITRVRGRRLRGNHNASNDEHTSMLRTLQMISTIAGLLIGACSQFLLAVLLWDEKLRQPAVDHLLIFAIIWSVCTVAVTATGCYSLRLLAVEDAEHDDGVSLVQRQRVQMRMEAHYVSATLVGICIAWIFMDICVCSE